MEIKLSDEQIQQMAEKQLRDILKPKIQKVLNDRYWSSQDLYEEINRAIYQIIEKRVNQIYNDKGIEQMVRKQDVSKVVAEKLIETVSEDIVESVHEHFNF